MIPITRQDILAHQSVVPWPSQHQVEQDLWLCRSMAALFSDNFLTTQIAMRGGTLLHKVHLAPPCRYSEDIDLVVFGDRPAEHVRRAIRRVLTDVLGKPVRSAWEDLKLAVRNTVKPSRVLRMTYGVLSIMEPGKVLGIVVEANVTERKPFRPIVRMPFAFSFRGSQVSVQVNGFDVNEMLGTKLRALFQRRRGRDLFDLYWALTRAATAANPSLIIDSFQHYLRQEGTKAKRDEFVGILEAHLKDRGFCSDMAQLLRADIAYDPQVAGAYLKAHLLNLLPESIEP